MSSRNIRDLINPFKPGDTVIVPEGSKFYTTNPDAESPSRTTRRQFIEVDYASGGANDHLVHEPDFEHRTVSGYVKRFILSRAILRENNKPIEYRDRGAKNGK
jgi:hypothetical protein